MQEGTEMGRSRLTAVSVGVLFLVATASYLAGSQLLASVLDAPDFLARVHPERERLVTGALLVLVDAMAVVGIAVLVFPLLRQQSEAIAVGYLSFRVIEAVLLVVGVLGPLALIALGEESLAAPAPPHLQTLGTLAVKGNYWAYQLAMVVLGVCGLMFCYALDRARLVPRPLALLGLIGYPLLATGAVLDMLGRVDSLQGSGMLLLLPGGLFELLLPLWLFARGFHVPVRTSGAVGLEAARA